VDTEDEGVLAGRPTAGLLGELMRTARYDLVVLPEPLAAEAVRRYLGWGRVQAALLERPGDPVGRGETLAEGEWAVVARPLRRWRRFLHAASARRVHDRRGRPCDCLVFRQHTLAVPRGRGRVVLQALEAVKPEEQDERGLPLPWVPPKRPVAPLGGREGADDDDVCFVPDGGRLEPLGLGAPLPEGGEVTWEVVEAVCTRLREHLGWAPFPLVVHRGSVDRRGVTTGRVWYGERHEPRRVYLTVCPNSDVAEVSATLAHELAHPRSGTRDHGTRFKRTLVELAGEVWGAAHLAEAGCRVGERHALVDAWVATGIRAALSGAPPPRPRTGDDGHTARLVSRIRKLRALAAAQPGEPEGVAATARANDLTTVYGLAGYQVQLDHGIDEQMVDRWVQLDRRKVWQRTLAHQVARFCGVFSLAMAGRARMHFFGRYRDVVAAEYLHEVAAASVERQCEAHLERWREETGPRRGAAARERTSFCDSAVRAFTAKLKEIREEERCRAEADPDTPEARAWRLATGDLDRARRFRREEHSRRGLSWGAGRGKAIRHSEEGYDAGRAIPVVKGIDSTGGAPRRLPEGGGEGG